MFLGGRLIRPGMLVVWQKKRGILLAPFVEVRDAAGRLTGQDFTRVQFHVVRDDRTTEAALTPPAEEFFASARLAKLKEIPEKSRPAKKLGEALGYL